jgi:hypothetical protein
MVLFVLVFSGLMLGISRLRSGINPNLKVFLNSADISQHFDINLIHVESCFTQFLSCSVECRSVTMNHK